tara:strand:- start:593 stop:868 length:276 start_codon:yes stop_codon:yes gene_type:complete
MEINNSKRLWVLARECPECETKPNTPPKLSFLVQHDPENIGDDENVKYVTFKTDSEAYEYAEDVLGEDTDDIIVMPLSEADSDPRGSHEHN